MSKLTAAQEAALSYWREWAAKNGNRPTDPANLGVRRDVAEKLCAAGLLEYSHHVRHVGAAYRLPA